MKYMIRDVFTCKRGKVPEYLESLKVVIAFMRSVGMTEHKVYADIAESMDTIFHEYEVDSLAGGELNAGLRAEWNSKDDTIRIGATAITDKGDGARTDMGAVDLRANIGDNTEVRAEVAASHRNDTTAIGWLVEAQHQTGSLDVIAYARSLDEDFGIGQQNGAELGRHKFGVDTRVKITEQLSVVGSVWQDDSLVDAARRRAAQVQLGYTTQNTDLRLGIAHFADRLNDGTRNDSTVLEGGVTQRLLDNRLELSASTSIALDQADSVDLPARHRFGARYALTDNVRLVGVYEIADGADIDARTIKAGFEVTPWSGAKALTTLGKQDIGEAGNRTFAAFGLTQSLAVTPSLTLDATLDGSRTLNGAGPANDIVNPSALTDPNSPIAGMPVLECWKGTTTIVLKRSMATGYAGVQNPLFFEENTRMLFGDAKTSLDTVFKNL